MLHAGAPENTHCLMAPGAPAVEPPEPHQARGARRHTHGLEPVRLRVRGQARPCLCVSRYEQPMAFFPAVTSRVWASPRVPRAQTPPGGWCMDWESFPEDRFCGTARPTAEAWVREAENLLRVPRTFCLCHACVHILSPAPGSAPQEPTGP